MMGRDGRPKVRADDEEVVALEILAEAVEDLRAGGDGALRALSAALEDALRSRTPEAIGHARRVFAGLAPGLRREVARLAMDLAGKSAYVMADRVARRDQIPSTVRVRGATCWGPDRQTRTEPVP